MDMTHANHHDPHKDIIPPPPPLERDKPWERAVLAFQDAGHTWGSLVSVSWLYEAMGLPLPESCPTVKKADIVRLKFFAQFDRMKRYLLVQCNMSLKNVRGEGYQVVMPEKQTETAMRDLHSGLSKLVRESMLTIKHVERSRLTDEQWRENQETIGKLSFFRRKARKELL